MRDILETLDQLAEGVGLANRRPGEKFANPQGEVLTFNGLDFYPETGNYESTEDMQDALAKVAAELGVDPLQIKWANNAGTNKAFGIARFIDANNQDYFIGRYFQKISPNRSDNRFKNDLPGGFKYQSRVAKKEATPYKPTDVLSSFENLTPQNIYQQIVAKFGEDSDEVTATKLFMQATSFPLEIPRGDINPDGFSNYFCEMLQPMALILGKPVKGNANEAEKIFFGSAGFDTCTISFHTGVSGGLYDSLLTNSQGKQILLSSKAKNGAMASVLNLIDKAEELKGTPNGDKILSKYREALAIIDIIKTGGHTNGCLDLGVLFGIIKADEKNQVKALKGLGPKDDVDSVIKSDNLKTLYKSRTPQNWDVIIPIEHMLSAIAYRVADHVNEKTNFGEAASTILNNGALVQMYTTVRSTQDKITIDTFHTVYPSATVTGVIMSAGKAYMSTQGKGNFTFKVLKNGATDSETQIDDLEVDAPDPGPAPKPGLKQPGRTDIKAVSTTATTGDEKALGRKRRT